MKKALLVAVIGLLVGGCTMIGGEPTYNFVNYGANDYANEVVVAEDGESVAWVYQEESGVGVKNIIYSADKNGENQTELVNILVDDDRDMRVMGYYPETKSLIFSLEAENTEFGPAIQRELFFKFFDAEDFKSVGNNFIECFDTDKGIYCTQVGKSLAYYQFSMNNLYAIDTVANYNQNFDGTPSLFTDIQLTEDKARVVYVHEYEPATQGFNQNKLLVSDLEGANRRELLATAEAIDLMGFVDADTIKVKVGEEEREIDI